MTITEKIANLKGFIEGIALDESKPENKVIAKIADILEDMAYEIEELGDSVDTLEDYAEELDEDLGEVEEYLFDDECEEDECDCCDCEDCDCDECEEDEFYEIECPKCGEKICVDFDYDSNELVCPACNEKINLLDEE